MAHDQNNKDGIEWIKTTVGKGNCNRLARELAERREQHTEHCPCKHCQAYRHISEIEPNLVAGGRTGDALWYTMLDLHYDDRRDKALADGYLPETVNQGAFEILRHRETGERIYLARKLGEVEWTRCTNHLPPESFSETDMDKHFARYLPAGELWQRYPDGDIPAGEVWTQGPALLGPGKVPRPILHWEAGPQEEDSYVTLFVSDGQGRLRQRIVGQDYNNIWTVGPPETQSLDPRHRMLEQ